MIHRPSISPLFPYTTLFRSLLLAGHHVSHPRIRSQVPEAHPGDADHSPHVPDRKSTRLNSSHVEISYAVFCLKKKKIDAHDSARQLRTDLSLRNRRVGTLTK